MLFVYEAVASKVYNSFKMCTQGTIDYSPDGEVNLIAKGLDIFIYWLVNPLIGNVL